MLLEIPICLLRKDGELSHPVGILQEVMEYASDMLLYLGRDEEGSPKCMDQTKRLVCLLCDGLHRSDELRGQGFRIVSGGHLDFKAIEIR